MRNILCIFALISCSAFAEDFAKVQNLSGSTVVVDGLSGSLTVPAGASFSIPRDTEFSSVWYVEPNLPGVAFVCDAPLVCISASGGLSKFGVWDLDKWACFRMGLALAVPVFGYVLGSWLFRSGLGMRGGGLGED